MPAHTQRVPGRRELIDVEDFHRLRAVAALTRGDPLATGDVARRPNAALAAGVVVALLIAAATAAGAFLSGRLPDGWLGDGSLVVDEATGSRYVAQGGALRPAPTLTGALLAGARDRPVLVPHDAVVRVPLGRPLAGADLPERPPQLPDRPTGFTACTDGRTVDVYAGTPTVQATPEQGLLVRTPRDDDAVLLAGASAHRVPDDALVALGLASAPVRDVPQVWLDLLPRGPDLTVATPPLSAAPDGDVPGVDVPGVGASGDVVRGATTGRLFRVADGQVRPFANTTSELLAGPVARDVPEADLAAAPPGPPAGIPDAPDTPPAVPGARADVVVCTPSSLDGLSVGTAVADAGTMATTPVQVGGEPAATTVSWHFPPGQGALVAAPDVDRPRPASRGGASETDGIQVVAGGVSHPVADGRALQALSYQRSQAVVLPEPWLDLLEPGAPLVADGDRR